MLSVDRAGSDRARDPNTDFHVGIYRRTFFRSISQFFFLLRAHNMIHRSVIPVTEEPVPAGRSANPEKPWLCTIANQFSGYVILHTVMTCSTTKQHLEQDRGAISISSNSKLLRVFSIFSARFQNQWTYNPNTWHKTAEAQQDRKLAQGPGIVGLSLFGAASYVAARA